MNSLDVRVIQRTFQSTLLALLIGLVGCVATRTGDAPPVQQETLSLVMPSRIAIVAPFTGVASFNGDGKPDGIELVLQAFSSLDNPGVMIAGHLRIELFEYVKASANISASSCPLTVRKVGLPKKSSE